MVSNQVLKTLIYENIFDFPLYRDEIWKFLISDKKISTKKFDELLQDKRIYFDEKSKLYGISKQKNFYSNRIQSRKRSLKKEEILDYSIRLLSKVPTIKFIGVSGSQAQFADKYNDDLDLFIIVDTNTVWTTRLFCVILLKVNNLYRTDTDYSSKICLNMMTDTFSLAHDRRDLYNAIEIAQLRPKLSRDQSYNRFIKSNSWTKKFLPNFKQSNFDLSYPTPKIIRQIFRILLSFRFEKASSILQLAYMRNRTSETVGDHLLAFHPIDFRGKIMEKYEDQVTSTRGH